MAPILLAAMYVMGNSVRAIESIATRSPFFTPASIKAFAARSIWALKSAQVRRVSSNTSASAAGVSAAHFSI
ncbi:MAG: hypothetical protein BWY96_03189 [Spirochaetes bacterium ADurb.BinA120]|nr:MAG: hypothetical protein BWY96_03189 [Spirochaetes bacterium ADurb.BinA120]